MATMTRLACLFFCAASFALPGFAQDSALPATSTVAPEQGHAAVALKDEPHHHLILENSYVRVFRVEIISPDATLLHRHDFSYAYMSIGKAEFTNAVEGKPEVRINMSDGQLGYSKGGFSHAVRTQSDTPFYNITIELLQPQGNARSTCAKEVQGPLQGCSDTQPAPDEDVPAAVATAGAKKPVAPATPPVIKPILDTDGAALKSARFSASGNYKLNVEASGILLVIAPLSQFKVDFADGSSKLLSGGDPLWLAPGSPVTITNVSEQKGSTLFLFSFKAAEKASVN